MDVQLVSPEQILYQGVGKMVVVRTLGGGDIAFEDNHAPFLGALADWPARVKFEDGTQAWFAVHGGFVEVSNNQVIILSDVAELAADIDVDRAHRGEDARRRSAARRRRRRARPRPRCCAPRCASKSRPPPDRSPRRHASPARSVVA